MREVRHLFICSRSYFLFFVTCPYPLPNFFLLLVFFFLPFVPRNSLYIKEISGYSIIKTNTILFLTPGT